MLNMFNILQEQTVEIMNGLFEDHFEASVKMSSYLLAFIVCDFKSVSGLTATGINVRMTRTQSILNI